MSEGGFVIKNNQSKEKIRILLTETADNILKFEENLVRNRPANLSIKEIHVLEAIAKSAKNETAGRASDIAISLRIAPGTLTATADVLEKKNYITRFRDVNDQRSVRIMLTEKGNEAIMLHESFHENLINELVNSISDEDVFCLTKAQVILQSFFIQKERTLKNKEIKILVDSTCDINPIEAQALGITMIPMSTSFGHQVYKQNIDLTSKQFFQKLTETDVVPTTSQLTPFDFEKTYREAIKDGSEVVAIHLSSTLSGTFQSAVVAARQLSGVYPVDSQTATAGIALLVRIAVLLRDAGKDAQQIAKKIKELSERVVVLAYIPTLKYLVRGGRVSPTAGLIGSILNIYPIISVQNGIITNIAKAKGQRMAQRKLAKIAEEYSIDKQYGVVFAHADAESKMYELKANFEGQLDNCDIQYCEIGAVIGTHTGPGAVGIAFIRKQEK